MKSPLYEEYRLWAERHVRPTLLSRDRSEEFDPALWRALASQGFFELLVPRELGGRGASVREFTEAFGGLAHGSMDIPWMLTVGAHAGVAISLLLRHGTPEQQRAHLPEMAKGLKIGALCNSEAHGGTHLKSLKSHFEASSANKGLATLRKSAATNLSIAGLIFASAWKLQDEGEPVLEVLLLEASAPLKREKLSLGGFRTGDTGSLDGRDVPLSFPENRLGPDGSGGAILKTCFDLERFLIPVIVEGILQGMLEQALRFSAERESFGKPLAHFQFTQEKIVRLYSVRETLGGLIERLRLSGAPGPSDFPDDTLGLSHLKMFAVEGGFEAATIFSELYGAQGYGADHLAQKLVRDWLGLKSLGGTKEQHKMAIMQALLSRESRVPRESGQAPDEATVQDPKNEPKPAQAA